MSPPSDCPIKSPSMPPRSYTKEATKPAMNWRKFLRILSEAEMGERKIDRMVLSGHSVGSQIWGDDNGEIGFDELERLGRFTDLSAWVVNIADPLFGFQRRWRREVPCVRCSTADNFHLGHSSRRKFPLQSH